MTPDTNKTLVQLATLALLGILSATATHSSVAATTLQIGFTAPGSVNEFTRSAFLTWNADPGCVYKVQSRATFGEATPWITEEPVLATSPTMQWSSPGGLAAEKYYRLILPQPAIVSVEPAVFAPGVAVALYIVGQCFGSNDVLRINGVPQTNAVYLSPTLVSLPAFTPDVPGTYALELVVGGTVVSSFNATCADAVTNPELVLQEPPEEPPASPQTLLAGFLSKKGYDYYKAKSDLASAGAHTNPYFKTGFDDDAGDVIFETQEGKKGLNAVNVKLARMAGGGGGGGGESIDLFNAWPSGYHPPSLAAKSAKITKSRSNIQNNRSVGGGPNGQGLRISGGVQPFSGEVQLAGVDFAIPGRGLDFIWARTYRSRTSHAATVLGNRWSHSYDVSVEQDPSGIAVNDGTGRRDVYFPGTNGVYSRPEFFNEGTLSNNTFTLTFPDTGKWVFNSFAVSVAAGKLALIVDRNGNTMRLGYDSSGRLTQVVDDLGRTNTVGYNPVGQLASVTDFSGRTVAYAYYPLGETGGSPGDLKSVTLPPVTGTPNGNDFPDGKTTTHTYSTGFADDRENHLLLSIIDAKGQTVCTYVYQHNQTDLEFLRCIAAQDGTNVPAQFRYVPHAINPSIGDYATIKCIANDPVGNVTESFFDSRNRCVIEREFTGRAVPGLPVTDTLNRPAGKLRLSDPDYYETVCVWNNDSLCTRLTAPLGDAVECIYERDFDASTGPRKKGDPRLVHELASGGGADTDGDGVLDTTVLTTTFQYDPRFGSRGFRDDRQKVLNGEVLRFAAGPRQTTSLDGTYAPHTRKFRARFPLVDNSLYISGGFVISATDARGTVTEASYDSLGNRVKVKFPWLPGAEADFAYDMFGQCTAITNAPDANGRRRQDEYVRNYGFVVERVVDAGLGGIRLTNIFERDARGNVTRYVDARGNDTLYTYNALDQCVRLETPTNIIARCATDYAYDANDNLVQASTDLLNEKDKKYSVKSDAWSFDVRNLCREHVASVSNTSFVTNRFDYDGNGNLATVYSPLAVSGLDAHNLQAFQYDERGLLYRCVQAPGSAAQATDQWNYDLNGNKIYLFGGLESAEGARVTQFGYDGFRRCVSVTDALGNVETCAYDRNGNLIYSRVDAESNDGPGATGNQRYSECRWKYDGLDRGIESRVAFFDPVTQTPIGDGLSLSSCTYAPNGDCLSETDDNGHTTRYTYDTVSRLSSITDPKTNVVSYTYDECDNVLSATQTDRSDLTPAIQQFTVIRAYDKLHRLTRSVDNVGNTNRYAYDSLDNLVSAVDARGNETVCAYDKLSRCVQTTCYQGLDRGITINTTHVEYNVNSRCASTTDANSNMIFYAYDSLDRQVATTNADGTTHKLVWSPRSNLVRAEDANGTVITNVYDLCDRVVHRDIATGGGVATTTTFETFAYDGLSRLVAATNDVSVTTFAYDSLGNHTRGISGGLGAVVGTFDGVGNRLSMTYPSGRLVTYTYDALDQVTNVSSGSGGLPPTTLATFDYEGPGRIGRISRANNVNTRIQWNGLVNPPNASGDFGWGQVRGINHQAAGGGAVIDRRVSIYDQKQNKTLRAQTAPFFGNGPMTTNVFEYDPLDRLSRAINTKGNGSTLRSYTLDGNGNRQLVVSNGVAELYSMEATIPPGDFQMNQYTLTPFGFQSYDDNGNLIAKNSSIAQLQYQYDYADRLVEVADLSTGLVVPVVIFRYDALGRRISKTSYPPSPLAPVTTQFVYGAGDDDCDGDIIEEYEAGVLAVSCVSVLGGAGGGAAAASYASTGLSVPPLVVFGATGVPTFLHADDLGNTLALTDAGGNVTERYDYDDFGTPSFLTNDGFPIPGANVSPAGNPFLFHGMEWDAETGLYFSGTKRFGIGDTAPECPLGKYFDPQTGRGTTPVPNLPPIPGMCPGRSAYTFAGDNPWSAKRSVNRMISITVPDIIGGFESRRATAIGRLCREGGRGYPETQMLRAMFGLTGTAVTNGAIGRPSLIGRCVPRNLQGIRL